MSDVSQDSAKLAVGQQVFTAVAFIYHDFNGITKVFMAKRADTKKFLPDVFELPGGHIDFGEDFVTGLAREIDEEFSMKVRIGDPFAVFTYMNEIKGSHSVEVAYFAQFTDPIEKIQLDPTNHSEYRWVAADELEQVYSLQKGVDDAEFAVVRKGFTLLAGESLVF